MFEQALEYWTDAWQRSVLTLEALNERETSISLKPRRMSPMC